MFTMKEEGYSVDDDADDDARARVRGRRGRGIDAATNIRTAVPRGRSRSVPRLRRRVEDRARHLRVVIPNFLCIFCVVDVRRRDGERGGVGGDR